MVERDRFIDWLLDIWFGSTLLRVIVVAVIVVAIVLTLGGCAETHPKPMVLTVERKIYVPVPAAMTQHCEIAEPGEQQGQIPVPAAPANSALKGAALYWWGIAMQAIGVAHARKGSLQKCNADKDEIHAIQATPATESH